VLRARYTAESNGLLLNSSREYHKKHSPSLVVSSNHFANFLAEDDLVIPSRADSEGSHNQRTERARQAVGSVITCEILHFV